MHAAYFRGFLRKYAIFSESMQTAYQSRSQIQYNISKVIFDIAYKWYFTFNWSCDIIDSEVFSRRILK